jgi:hypothetical protein
MPLNQKLRQAQGQEEAMTVMVDHSTVSRPTLLKVKRDIVCQPQAGATVVIDKNDTISGKFEQALLKMEKSPLNS